MALFFWTGCVLQPETKRLDIESLGYFEYRPSRRSKEGLVVGAPHGLSDPDSAEIARKISERLGAGLVIAYGFKRKHLAVAQPIFYSRPPPDSGHGPSTRGSAFLEYRRLLDRAAQGILGFYIEIHRATQGSKRLEVTSSGLTIEELQALKDSYLEIRNRFLGANPSIRIPIAIESLDQISWRVSGIKNHGTLLFAKRGLSLRLPDTLKAPKDEKGYVQILSTWLADAVKLITKNSPHLPRIKVKWMGLGRFDMIPPRLEQPGIVIGAPHGSFDEHTAEFATRLSQRTGFAAVVARGFTPAEADGWRINVNRPTEKTFTSAPQERRSERAERIYQAYKSLVLEAAGKPLGLYIDIHEYAPGKKIQVATCGLSRAAARFIKSHYQKIRNQRVPPGMPAVDLDIEPLDPIELRALAAKSYGILAIARKSLHFELPEQPLLSRSQARIAYAEVISELLAYAAPRLMEP